MRSPVFRLLERDNGWKAMTKLLHGLADGKTFVKAGVIGAKGDAQHEGEPITIARLAAVHEFGAVISHAGVQIVIPERSFIRSTWAAKREDYFRHLRNAVKAVVDRRLDLGQFPRMLGAIGMKIVSDMQTTIRSGIAPELSPMTLAQRTKPDPGSKAAQSGAGPIPLIDTGQLINSLSYATTVDGKEG